MTAIAGILDRPWAPLVLPPLVGLVVVGVTIAALNRAFPTVAETRTVVKVCLNGALVLRRPDGEFRVLRPGAVMDWPAVGPEICQ